MATHMRNSLDRKENRALLWTAVGLVAIAVSAYIGYVTYYPTEDYTLQSAVMSNQ